MNISLRSQLLFRLIIFSVVLVGGMTWFGYKDVVHETQELFDAQLARSARIILSLAQAQNNISNFSNIQEYLDENGLAMMYINFEEQDDEQQTESGHAYETKLAFQIWDDEGNLLVKSYNAPLEPMSIEENGFANVLLDDYNWRTFSLHGNNQQYRCITAERIDVRNDLIVKISNDLFYMSIILIPALSLILYLTIDRGLKPLQYLASQINRRSEKNLELIQTDYKYSEIVTIKNALNQLLDRLNETWAREKRFTSDAAHELRTPLAAIRLHTELAKNAKNSEQQNESLDQVIKGVDRTTHLVEQLLALARLEPELLAKDFIEVNFTQLVIEESTLLSHLAINKDIEMSFNETQCMSINGNESALRLLIRNLLMNAISYTPPGGKVMIDLSTEDTKKILVIEDSGPGILEEDRERVLDRFYRAENHQEPGCGIGLSIVNRVVQMHQGSMQLANADSGTGLKVIIEL